MFERGIRALNVVLLSPLRSCCYPQTVTGHMKVS